MLTSDVLSKSNLCQDFIRLIEESGVGFRGVAGAFPPGPKALGTFWPNQIALCSISVTTSEHRSRAWRESSSMLYLQPTFPAAVTSF